MQLEEQRILFILRATSHGGNENIVVWLCRIFSPLVKEIVICSAGGFKAQLLDDMEITYYTIPDIENKNPKVVMAVWNRISSIIGEKKITIVHTHHRMAALYAWMLRKKYHYISINTMHTVFYDKRLLTRLILNQTNVVACGNKVRDNLVSFYGVQPNRVTVIQNAVMPFDAPLKPLAVLEEQKRNGYVLVGMIGRLSPEKGTEYFVRAIPLVKSKKKVKYVIVGDGSERDRIKNIAQELGVYQDILFLGYREDVQNIIAQLDFIVLSSLQEGLPLVPIEAFSVGRTIVATRVEGTLEVVRDGVNGLLVEPRDSAGLAEKIRWLIAHDEERLAMEANAKESYDKYFSFDIFRQKYIHYYEQLLSEQL